VLSDIDASAFTSTSTSTTAGSCASGAHSANDSLRVALLRDVQEDRMDLLMKQGAQLAPKNTAEAIGIFRAQVIGPLLTRVFTSHGQLAEALRALSRERHWPPHSSATRTYSEATLERWYYRFKKRSLAGITPQRRSDVGHARELTDAQRDLLLASRASDHERCAHTSHA
jgi:hypothetical protein